MGALESLLEAKEGLVGHRTVLFSENANHDRCAVLCVEYISLALQTLARNPENRRYRFALDHLLHLVKRFQISADVGEHRLTIQLVTIEVLSSRITFPTAML